jgi:YidC/Oxa1 family membrane protein insertase
LLSTALIMAYQFFYAGPRMRRAQELKRAQQERMEASQPKTTEGVGEEPVAADYLAADKPVAMQDPARLEDETAPAPLPKAGVESARLITVVTPLYEITLSTLGAEVVAVRLLDYETEGQPVQMVRDDPTVDGGLIRVTLVGDERALPLEDVLFEAYSDRGVEPLLSGATITVGEGDPERKLLFRTEGADGGSILREYTFASGTYLVRSRVQFAMAGYPFTRKLVWGFGPGLRATEKNTQGDYDAMRASLRLGDEYYRKKRGDFDERYSGMVHWASLQVKYFTARRGRDGRRQERELHYRCHRTAGRRAARRSQPGGRCLLRAAGLRATQDHRARSREERRYRFRPFQDIQTR